MECSAKIDLDFIRRQAQISVPDRNEIIISYNVTALDASSMNPQGPIIERDDVTNSLIYKNMKLPSVIIRRRPDMEFATLVTDENGFPSIQVEVPGISGSNYFDLFILQTTQTNVWKLKLEFVFSSQLRFLWTKEQEGGAWKLQGTPSPRGVAVKMRQRNPPQSQQTSDLDDLDDLQPSLLSQDILHSRTTTRIGQLRFERVSKDSNRFSSSISEPYPQNPTSLPHLGDSDNYLEIEETEEPDYIKIKVASIDWPKGVGNMTAAPDLKGRLVRLPIPENLPDPNSMHVFVQFQVNAGLNFYIFTWHFDCLNNLVLLVNVFCSHKL
ncbi:unnamed protein product [Mesocestoides corti]|uniref:DUF5735 domain-containing protein n=1 Tax=Mesocestoides corti TaxID=53468 RepID=A0A0R3UJN7_MESCO|nr:unnamed protein product [Mesocestoides corti]